MTKIFQCAQCGKLSLDTTIINNKFYCEKCAEQLNIDKFNDLYYDSQYNAKEKKGDE